MFGFKSKEQQKKELLEEIRLDEEKRQAELALAVERAQEDERAKIKAEEVAREAEALKMKESEEPWVEVKGMVQDPDNGIKIDLDWNDAFVKHLRENGYVGASDDQIVQRYIAVLAQQVAGDMAENQLNENE